ncbi:MAG: hypothetical protein AB2A00_18320 [Myxococcota bacterium]
MATTHKLGGTGQSDAVLHVPGAPELDDDEEELLEEVLLLVEEELLVLVPWEVVLLPEEDEEVPVLLVDEGRLLEPPDDDALDVLLLVDPPLLEEMEPRGFRLELVEPSPSLSTEPGSAQATRRLRDASGANQRDRIPAPKGARLVGL